MDWARAKTILIIIFLILNIFLLYNLATQGSTTVLISEKDIADLKIILQKNNIELKGNIPNKIKQQAFLEIEDVPYVETDLANKFLGPDSQKTSQQGVNIYRNGNKSLQIFQDKKIIYNDAAPNDNITGFSQKKVIKYVENYLKSKGLTTRYGVVNTFSATPDGYYITYKQEYKGTQVLASYMNIKLTNNGIAQIERIWFMPVQFVDIPKDIKSPTEILLIFAKELANKEKIEINNVTLGYYFPAEELKNVSISAIPVWKIILSTGQTYYYNAYEGYLEYKQ